MSRKAQWELNVSEQRELRKRGAELLYRRVQLLVQCYEDSAFQEHCESEGINDLDYLDGELEDTAANFSTLMAVFKAYPRESQWVNRNIRELIAEVLEAGRKERVPRQRENWKERCEAAEAECERLRAELATLRKLVELARLPAEAV